MRAKSSIKRLEQNTSLSADSAECEVRRAKSVSDSVSALRRTSHYRTLAQIFSLMFAYENLEVYKKAKAFHSQVFKFLKMKKGLPTYIKNQLGRAALSIMLNIAEGSGRFADSDRKHFYIMSRSSAFECAAIISVLIEEAEIDPQAGASLKESLENISRGLFAMIRNLEK